MNGMLPQLAKARGTLPATPWFSTEHYRARHPPSQCNFPCDRGFPAPPPRGTPGQLCSDGDACDRPAACQDYPKGPDTLLFLYFAHALRRVSDLPLKIHLRTASPGGLQHLPGVVRFVHPAGAISAKPCSLARAGAMAVRTAGVGWAGQTPTRGNFPPNRPTHGGSGGWSPTGGAKERPAAGRVRAGAGVSRINGGPQQAGSCSDKYTARTTAAGVRALCSSL